MGFNEETIQSISSIYRCVYQNQEIHRNALRKQLTSKGKISASKFPALLESLVALGKIKIDKEMVSLNPSLTQVGILQKNGNDFYVVTPNSKKHFKISKSVASGYKTGDILDVVIEHSEKESQAIVLGRSSREFVQENAKTKSPQKQQPKQTESIIPIPADRTNCLLGRVIKLSHDELVFIPNKKSLPVRQIPILNNREEYSAFQDRICVMNVMNMDAPLLGGHIIKVKGEAGNPIHEYDAIAENYGAIMSWNDSAVQEEIKQIPTTVDIDSLNLISEEEAAFAQKGNVVDLRHLPFSTIDPATCKDMDDAIYSTFDENGDYVCYTAVANVTKYVDLNSNIGQRYIAGGFTIYAPNKAYNILPTQLSTGICSLNPNEDRLAFVVKTVIDKTTGKAKSSNIYDAIIQSRQKYSYEDAQEAVDILEDVDYNKEVLRDKLAAGHALTDEEQLLMNYYAAAAIKTGFAQRKMIRFNANKEREIVFDSDLQDIVDIKTCPHLLYHEVIEAFMITANEATAKYAKDNNLPNIYRVHDEPNPQKTGRANEFFDILGIEFDGELSAQSTISLIELIKGTANEEIINKFLIKMQSRAVYSDHLYSDKKTKELQDWLGDPISHYALQSPHYSHTTSPIRRVPDYITQYNILANMHGTKPLSKHDVQQIVDIANERQLDVDQAEKDFDDISSVIYCEKHIGETMSGRISKFRMSSPEESYDDNIVVIVKNEEKGISVEIPLHQILGHHAYDCSLTEQRCAVYDSRGNIVLTLCKPLDFIIDKADRKTMTVVGKTNRAMVQAAESRTQGSKYYYGKKGNGYINQKRKNKKVKRYGDNKSHHTQSNYEDDGYQK